MSLQAGVRLTAIFDSCHSGSALDLPYLYSTQGVLKEPNLAKEAGQGLLGIVSSYAKNDLIGMATKGMGLLKKVTQGDDVFKKNLRTKTSPADVIMWSGSKDTQTSYVEMYSSTILITLISFLVPMLPSLAKLLVPCHTPSSTLSRRIQTKATCSCLTAFVTSSKANTARNLSSAAVTRSVSR